MVYFYENTELKKYTQEYFESRPSCTLHEKCVDLLPRVTDMPIGEADTGTGYKRTDVEQPYVEEDPAGCPAGLSDPCFCLRRGWRNPLV